MAVCFTLTKRGCTEPVTFQYLDEVICLMLGKPCDPDKYYGSWYDIIGLRLAMGQDWAKIIEAFMPVEDQSDLELLAICAYLQANYSSENWRAR